MPTIFNELSPELQTALADAFHITEPMPSIVSLYLQY